jgi:hypothetical protein
VFSTGFFARDGFPVTRTGQRRRSIAVVSSHAEYGDVGFYMLKGSFSQPLIIDSKTVVNTSLTLTTAVAPTNSIVVQPTLVTSRSITSNAQLLAATTPTRNSSPVLQSASNLATTSVSQRAAPWMKR